MNRKLTKVTQWAMGLVVGVLTLLVALAAYTNVPTAVTDADASVFIELGLNAAAKPKTFSEEIALIREVQHKVFQRAPFGDGIPDYEPREPADLMRFGQGLCYDRSRTFDKSLKFLGFESRHVYLLYREGKPFLTALFQYGQSSHAVTEVKTSKGWMFVDSNTPWVALTRSGEPVNADDVWRRYAEFDSAPSYLKPAWWAIRGMYSRKGHLYGAGIVFPEFNWPTFVTWLVTEK